MVIISCEDDDPPPPVNTAQFEIATDTLGDAKTETTVKIIFERAAETDGSIRISFNSTGVAYYDDFTTWPRFEEYDGTIRLIVQEGSTTASFAVSRTATRRLEGNAKVDFTIESLPFEAEFGDQKTFTMLFRDVIEPGAKIQIDGGGTHAENRVFIDLSANSQVKIARTKWDLALTTDDKWRVVLNSSNNMRAYALDKYNLADVKAADTVGLGARPGVDVIDDPNGDLTKTAIAEVGANNNENRVYIINRGTGPDNLHLGWLKVKVVRFNGRYIVNLGGINEIITIGAGVTKDPVNNFSYMTFNGDHHFNFSATVEPPKADWDIAWTGFTTIATVGGEPTPDYEQDIIITNIHGGARSFAYTTGVTGTKTYDTFTAADLSAITYSTSQLAIGSSWRTLNPPAAETALVSNRFYIVQDPVGNVYKLRFTALVVNGERGKPEFEFVILKKGG